MRCVDQSCQVIRKQPERSTHALLPNAALQQTTLALDHIVDDVTKCQEGIVEAYALRNLNQLQVVQKLHCLEVCLGWTRNNRYSIYNCDGHQIFYVYEDSECFDRQVAGALRGLTLRMSQSDGGQQEVMLLHRPAACSSRCCWAFCNLQRMEVLSVSGIVLAHLQEVWSCFVPEYRVTDNEGNMLWTVRGGLLHCRCCCLVQFSVFNKAGEISAIIARNCQGCKEIIASANTYTIHCQHQFVLFYFIFMEENLDKNKQTCIAA